MRRLELVRARQEVDGQRPGRLAVQPAERVVVLGAELPRPTSLIRTWAAVAVPRMMMSSNSSVVTRRPGAATV